ncbi:MAG: primosomal protein N' [Oscillospiraceae bacterium]|jgi:primosomal protein N' (replication factor Y)|nr:primosomal protein N' [Oscillospiraceae bacterium]
MNLPYAAVAIEQTSYHYDAPFDYLIPFEMQGLALPGCRVIAPFGNGAPRQGLILELHNRPSHAQRKPLRRMLDETPLLPPDLVELIPWLKERCFCTLYEVGRAMLPAGMRCETQVLYSAAPETPPEALLDSDGRRLLETLRRSRSKSTFVRREKLLKACGLPAESRLPEVMAEQGFLLRHTDALQNVGPLAEKLLRLREGDPPPLTPKQAEVARFLRQNGETSLKELCEYLGISPAVAQSMARKGVLILEEREVSRGIRGKGAGAPTPIELTPGQQKAYDHLREPEKPVALLFGVTGSGKTSIYLKLIDDTLAKGRGALFLVPEIALTPQLLRIFTERYGEQVALFHSALSQGERMDEWKRVRQGKARLVLGTRSAVFAPMENIGLIILDEEHEHSYQSGQAPRYHARDVAKFRAAYHRALLLLGSATPSVESYTYALQGRYQLETLTERYGKAQLPQVRTVDLLAESSLLSRELTEELERAMAAGHQAILLMNRRGYHTFLACNSCRHVIQCPQCSISLTYHLANERVMCHYCGYSAPAPAQCPACGRPTIRFGGTGTQKIEAELARLLPGARVCRMDADSAAPRHAREQMLTAFRAREYDILVGTQMVAKGLDFENVTLVGVISIDQQLYFDDYRSLERSFDLLTQVVGRAGRGEHAGLALVQTMNPGNPIIRLAARQDYPAFYADEIRMRRAMIYPPYCELCLLGVSGENEQQVRTGAKYILERLRSLASGEFQGEKLIVLGPMPARVGRLNKKFRWRLLIKCANTPGLRAMVAQILVAFGKDSRFAGLSAYAELHPEEIL